MFEKLKYLEPEINALIAADVFAGANAEVIYKGEAVFKKSFGMADKEKKIPMTESKIFRLFSLTKPITSAAAMLLLERGKIELRYPVKWFLPTFENPMVMTENGTRPAKRDITLGDLMNMTSGILYPDGSAAGQKMGCVWDRQTRAIESGNKSSQLNTREFALEMGKCPLGFDPGEKWQYGASADVMGAVIETVSGMTLGEFMRENIFEPLGMEDTGFYVPPQKLDRLAQTYDRTEKGNLPYTGHNLCIFDCTEPPAFESGGAGLFSTIGDYSKFAAMLMGSGTYNGVNILGRKTVEFMRTSCLTPQQIQALDWDSMKGHGYGCFMRVLLDRTAAGSLQSEGAFGWDGWMGCYFSNDPQEELAMLYFIQLAGAGSDDFTRKLQNVIWGSV